MFKKNFPKLIQIVMDPYQEHILEHYREPQNFGDLPAPTHRRHEVNPTCGDSFTFTIQVDDRGKITDVGFSGEGCAISTASASMLSEVIKSKTLAEVLQLKTDFVMSILGIELSPTRLKCALLPLQAVTHLQKL